MEAVKDFKCIICGTQPTKFTWTDFYGEAICLTCGCPYQLLPPAGAEKKEYPSCNLDPEFIPWLKRYWEETHRFANLGIYLRPLSAKDKEDMDALAAWLTANGWAASEGPWMDTNPYSPHV